MIEVINSRIISIDKNANMTVIEDKDLQTLVNNMKEVIGDTVLDDKSIPIEPIYDYIIEKIYIMPDYAKWNTVSFKDKPKQKLLRALNKFIHDKISRRTK